MNSLDEEILTLIILCNKHFANAYGLCKVLAWRFGLINCSEIIGRIQMKDFVIVSFPISKTLKHFEITKAGLDVVTSEKACLKVKLIEEFPRQTDLIDSLFRYLETVI